MVYFLLKNKGNILESENIKIELKGYLIFVKNCN